MRTSLLILTLSAASFAQDRAGLPVPAAGNVTLPLDEYNRLMEQARKPARKPEGPPLAYSIKSAEMKLEVRGETVSGAIQLEGEVFRRGTLKVPLLAGMTIFDAQQQRGIDLPLQQEGGAHTAVLTGPASFSISLNAGLPLSIEAGRASFQLPVPAAGTVRLSLVIPGDHTNVRLNPGIITNRASIDGRTTIDATLVAGQPASVWWATRESAAPPVPREVRFLSDVKTRVSVSEAQLGMAVLIDINVVQGEPLQFELQIPAGYEITGATGASLDSSEVQGDVLTLRLGKTAARSYQFLVTMEKPSSASKADLTFLSVKGTQRETGEVLVEGEGAVELAAKEGASVKRMDLREISPHLRSLGADSLHSAYRYHKQPAETPGLSLEWVRFPDSKVLAAVAQQAVVTTLVTSEGRTLTEVRLMLKNNAQPFLKIGLPPGASIVSADVAGERIKPVQGPDGSRIPLLRPGFRPVGSYPVSFVFMHSGAPFAKKGGSELALPGMDVAIGLLEWEVFLPERYKVSTFGGNAISRSLLPAGTLDAAADEESRASTELNSLGQLGGKVVDPTGAVVAGAMITVIHPAGYTTKTVSDGAGRWIVSNVPSGRVRIVVESTGFARLTRELDFDANRPLHYTWPLQVGQIAETIEVTANTPTLHTTTSSARGRDTGAQSKEGAQNAASANVVNLQRRVAGVLPIPVDVPRAGNSYRFVRPLVVDEETRVTFRYRM